MCTAFPCSDYYRSSVPSRQHPLTTSVPADQRAAGREGDRRDGSHVHSRTLRRVRCPAMPLQPRHTYAAGIRCGLSTGDITQPKSSPTRPRHRRGPAGARCNPAPIRQVRAGGLLLRGVQPLVFHVHLSVSLAGPRPSDGAGLSRRCQGCFYPPRRLPSQAALSFNRPTATSRWRCPFTTAGFKSASWRSRSATHNRSGRPGANARPTRSGIVYPSGPGIVVRQRRRMHRPAMPCRRIRRRTRLTLTSMPVSRSSRCMRDVVAVGGVEDLTHQADQVGLGDLTGRCAAVCRFNQS